MTMMMTYRLEPFFCVGKYCHPNMFQVMTATATLATHGSEMQAVFRTNCKYGASSVQ